jgi:hypothetical protein
MKINFSILAILFLGSCTQEKYLCKIKGSYSIVKAEAHILNDSSLIKGFVFDKKDKNLLSYTSISLRHTDIGVISDKDGFFSLKTSKGKYKICAFNTGYTNLCTKEILLEPNTVITINFYLGTTIFE